jgi:hypothetical protein
MGTMYFSDMASFSRHLKQMQDSIGPEKRKSWLQRVMGETIRDLIKVSFLAGKDGNGARWTSSAAETKFGDRFAESYKTRPSGAEVTADKVRLTDTAELRGSYQILSVDSEHVEVGPRGERNKNIALRAETIWRNAIAGFGTFRERIVMIEVNKAWDHFANGIPISRIRKPQIRAM